MLYKYQLVFCNHPPKNTNIHLSHQKHPILFMYRGNFCPQNTENGSFQRSTVRKMYTRDHYLFRQRTYQFSIQRQRLNFWLTGLVRPAAACEMGRSVLQRMVWRRSTLRAVQSSMLGPHSIVCQIHHIVQLVHIFAAVRGAVSLVIFVCTFCAYRDDTDFLWGNISYTRKVVE